MDECNMRATPTDLFGRRVDADFPVREATAKVGQASEPAVSVPNLRASRCPHPRNLSALPIWKPATQSRACGRNVRYESSQAEKIFAYSIPDERRRFMAAATTA